MKTWRQGLLEQVYGEVLEIGAGTGANIEFYPEAVTKLVMAEPDKNMRKQLRAKLSDRGFNRVSVSADSAENIDASDESYDFVVTSLVCCSVASLDSALLEFKRVLRIGGRLVFLEHVAADQGSNRRQWQNRINPLWRKLAGNCHLNRETEEAIVAAGFEISDIKRESMRKALPLVRPTIRGFALKGKEPE